MKLGREGIKSVTDVVGAVMNKRREFRVRLGPGDEIYV